MILLDTSGLLAAIDGGQDMHRACAAALAAARAPLLLSPFVLAELDYLLATKVGDRAQGLLLEQVERGAYQLESFDAGDVRVAREVMARYADLRVGLADASIVVLAARHGVRDVLTLNTRHFATMKQLNGRPFRLVPTGKAR